MLLQTSMEKKSPPVESKGHANLPGCLLHHFFCHSAAMGLSPNPYSNTVSGGPHRASMSSQHISWQPIPWSESQNHGEPGS